jgi:hypothetical protein
MSRRVLVAGLAAVAAFLAGVALSGVLSPLARRPILDGYSAPPPYNWVHPPPDLAKGNQQPARGSFKLAFGPSGSAAGVLSTSDVQFTLVAQKGMLPAGGGDASATITAVPLDPAKEAPLPGGLEAQGNVYRLEGAIRPSGRRVARLASPTQVVLTYAAQAGPHQTHTVLFSPDGKAWRRLKTTDVPNLQQAGANITELGDVVVGAPPAATVTSTPAGSQGGGGIPIAVWVVVASLLLVGLGLGTRLLSRRDGTA